MTLEEQKEKYLKASKAYGDSITYTFSGSVESDSKGLKGNETRQFRKLLKMAEEQNINIHDLFNANANK